MPDTLENTTEDSEPMTSYVWTDSDGESFTITIPTRHYEQVVHSEELVDYAKRILGRDA